MTLHRLIAEHLPWPAPEKRGNRAGLRLQWRVMIQGGAELVPRTSHPFEDGAAALLTSTNALPDDLVTMRHADAAHDSFLPQPLEQVAARARKRADAARRVREWKARQQP